MTKYRKHSVGNGLFVIQQRSLFSLYFWEEEIFMIFSNYTGLLIRKLRFTEEEANKILDNIANGHDLGYLNPEILERSHA